MIGSLRWLRWLRCAVLACGLMVLGGAQAATVPCTSSGPTRCPNNVVMYGTPALGVLNDTLWLVYQGDSAGTLWVTFYSDNTVDGGTWTTPVPFSTYFDSIVASGSPALARGAETEADTHTEALSR